MQIKTMAGTALVPTLSRIVLGITFILSGWFFCFEKIDFSAEDMATFQGTSLASTDAPASGDSSSDKALAVNRLILHFHAWDMDNWAQPLGWATAIFQLFAGGMMLVGLLTRIAALGLAVLIAGAFYQVTLSQNGMFEMNPFHWRLDSGMWYAIISQAALFVLAIGLLLTGGGPMCVDRVLWNRQQGGSAATKTKKGEGGE
jgi:uncharacterized membrane protein YphA (DoxX/SURF4 family)